MNQTEPIEMLKFLHLHSAKVVFLGPKPLASMIEIYDDLVKRECNFNENEEKSCQTSVIIHF